MEERQLKQINAYYQRRRRRKIWYHVVSGAAAVVVFVTTYLLILPALTLETTSVCGKEQHVHTEECYLGPQPASLRCAKTGELHTHTSDCYDAEGRLICGYADYFLHTHDESCYMDGVLVCGLKEEKGHRHDENCYGEQRVLVCTEEENTEIHTHDSNCYTTESKLHLHTEACYDGGGNLICAYAFCAPHVHNETCYNEEGTLICGQEEGAEHAHTEACYETSQVLTCTLQEGPQGHQHSEACYGMEKVVVCGKEEVIPHEHTDACFVNADGSRSALPVCGRVEIFEHIHTEECYPEPVLTCGLEEHEHDESCYPVKETTAEDSEDESAEEESEEIASEEETSEEESSVEIDEGTKEEASAEESEEEDADIEETAGEEGSAEETAEEELSVEDDAEETVSEEVSKEETIEEESSEESIIEESAGEEALADETTEESSDEKESLPEDGEEETTEEETAEADEESIEVASEPFETLYEDEIIKSYSDETIVVTAVYKESAKIPDGAELVVKQITEESDPEKYAKRMEELKDALNGADVENANNAFLSIGFYVNGEEVEPEDAVVLTIRFKNGEFEEGSPITVIHFAEEGTEKIEGSHIKDDSTTFEMSSFSDIILMDINVAVTDVTDDSSSQDGGSDFSQFIKNSSFAKNNNGVWTDATTFTEGEKIQVTMAFLIPEGVVTSANPTIYYNLPEGFLPEGITMTGPATTSDGATVGTYIITHDAEGKPKITITYNDDFVKDGAAFTGTIQFSTTASRSTTTGSAEYHFPGIGQSITVYEDLSQYDLRTNKSVEKAADGTLNYTIKVSSSKGTNGESITLTDTFIQDNDHKAVGSYVENAVAVIKKYDSTGTELSSASEKISGNAFEIKLGALEAGEYYEITYQAGASVSNDIGGDGTAKVKNSAIAKTDGNLKLEWRSDCEITVSTAKIAKYGSYSSVTGKITWTVKVYNPDNIDLVGRTVTDTLDDITGVSFDADSVMINDQKPAQGLDTSQSDHLFVYTFPEGSTQKEYTISYTTDAKDVQNKTLVNNTVAYDGWQAQGGVTVEHRELGVSKFVASDQVNDRYTEAAYTWNTTLSLSSDLFPEEGYLYEDTILDAVNKDGNVYSGTHYGVLKNIRDEINKTISLNIIENRERKTVEIGEYLSELEYHFYQVDENGDKTEVFDENSRVNYFTIKFRPKDGKNFIGYSLTFSYPTVAEFVGLEKESYWFKNEGKVNDKSVIGSKEQRIPKRLEKAVYVGKGEWSKDGEGAKLDNVDSHRNEYISNGTANIEYKDGMTLTYRVLVWPDSNEEITLLDNMPAGTTLKKDDTGIGGYAVYGVIAWLNTGDFTVGYIDKQGTFSDYSKGNYILQEHMHVETDSSTLRIKIDGGYAEKASFESNAAFLICYQLQVTDDSWDKITTTTNNYSNTIEWIEDGNSDGQEVLVERKVEEATKSGFIVGSNGKKLQTQKVTENGTEKEKLISEKGSELGDEFEDNTTYYQDVDGGWTKVTGKIEYTVIINPLSEDLDPDSENVTLVDTLTLGNGNSQASAGLDFATVKLYPYDAENGVIGDVPINLNRYRFTYEDSTNELKLVVPDELPCVLVYQYDVSKGNIAGDFAINNAVEFAGKTFHSNTITYESYDSSSTADRPKVTVDKVDSSNYGKKLADVKFKIYKRVKSGESESDWELVDKDNNGGVYTTNQNGEIIMDSQVGEEVDVELIPDILYRIVEIENPNDGYNLPADGEEITKYFVYLNNHVGDITAAISEWKAQNKNFIPEGVEDQIEFFNAPAHIYITNNYTKLKVQKIWVDADGNEILDPPESIQVKLYETTKVKDTKTVTVQFKDCDGGIISETKVNVGNGSSLEIKGWYQTAQSIIVSTSDVAPVVENNIESDNYVYPKISIEKVETDITISVIQGRKKIDQYGYWDYKGEWATSYIDPWTNEVKQIQYSWDQYPVLDENGSYTNKWATVVSRKIDGPGPWGNLTSLELIASIPESAAGDKLDVRIEMDSVTLKAIKEEGDGVKVGGDWSYTWTGLDADKIYTIEEINVPSGYTASYSTNSITGSGEIIITNKRQREPEYTELTVSKIWKDSEGNLFSPSSAASVAFGLYRTTDPNQTEGGILVGEYTMAQENGVWEQKITNLLSKDASGASYFYYVKEISVKDSDGEEIPSDSYVSNIDTAGKQVIITNISTTGLIIEKKWNFLNGSTCELPNSIQVELRRICNGYTDSNGINKHMNESELVDTYTLTAQNNWKLTVEGLPVVDDQGHTYLYSVVEQDLDGFKVDPSQSTSAQKASEKGSSGEYPIVMIVNQELQSYELPETGGPGTKWYTLGGLLLTLAAVHLLYKKRSNPINAGKG